MRNARAHKLQWSGPTVHSSTVSRLSGIIQTGPKARYSVYQEKATFEVTR